MVQTRRAVVDSPRSVTRKREILEAAARCFRRQGLAATGMREIAGELDMAVGNLYYYFTDKQELLAFCQEDALEGLLRLAAAVEELDETADRRLYLLLVGHVIRLHEGTPGSLAHLEVEALDDSWRPTILERRTRYESAVRRVIEEGVAQGLFRPVDAALAARAVLGAVNWTVKWYDPSGERPPRVFARELAEHLTLGLLDPGYDFIPPEPDPISSPLEDDSDDS